MSSEIDILVHEVGPRDGLQATSVVMPTAQKLAWISAMKNAGLRKIQVGSFVPPKLLPQLADSAEVVRDARSIGGFTVSALVPNLKGAENALAAGAEQLNFVMSVSEEHNLANVRRTHQQSLDEFAKIVELVRAHPDRERISVSGGLATCFGCTIAGAVAPEDVYALVEKYLAAGADRIGIADTVGYGHPRAVNEVFRCVLDLAGSLDVGAHFHDTRGLGLANAYAAVEAGVRELDGCLGGLGGCPFAPGATGNVVTEDLVFMLEAMGLRTGIDLDRLLEARQIMEAGLGGEPTHGTFVKAGRPKGFVAAAALAG